jgi:hypothetical protein
MATFGRATGRSAGLRAEAEAFAESLRQVRGTPGWGDAVRHYVLNLAHEPGPHSSGSWPEGPQAYRQPLAGKRGPSSGRSPPPQRRAPPPQVSERDVQAAQSLLPPSYRDQPPRDPSLGGLLRESRQGLLRGESGFSRRGRVQSPRAKKPSVDAQYSAILANEGGTNPDGSFRISDAGAIGPAQIVPKTAPEAAKKAFLPFDERLYRTDRAYNEALGRAYYNSLLDEFGDPAKAAAAYNSGPTRFRSILREAQRAGEPDNWEAYLPKETRDYVRNFRIRLGLHDEDLPAGRRPKGK